MMMCDKESLQRSFKRTNKNVKISEPVWMTWEIREFKKKKKIEKKKLYRGGKRGL